MIHQQEIVNPDSKRMPAANRGLQNSFRRSSIRFIGPFVEVLTSQKVACNNDFVNFMLGTSSPRTVLILFQNVPFSYRCIKA